MDKKRFKKLFPHLAGEMSCKESKVIINSIRSETPTKEAAAYPDKPVRFTPDAIDFIRRCDNEKQAQEIIDYLRKRGEISQQYAKKLEDQLRKRGVRSFGPKKEEGYYLKKF
jgi:hypothetical protein